MKHSRWPLLLVLTGILFPGGARIHGALLWQPAQQAVMQQVLSPATQDAIHFERAPFHEYVKAMIGRLGIAIVLIDNFRTPRFVTFHKDAPASKQDLLDLFITGLRDCDAMLVKDDEVYEIVPWSPNVRQGLKPATSLAQIAPASQSSRMTVPRIMMSFEGISLSAMLEVFPQELGIIPIAVDPAVRGSLSIICSASISKEEMFQILMVVLKNNNAMLIESDGKYRIVPFSKTLPEGWNPVRSLPVSTPAPGNWHP
jgi:hypothetical protein